MKLCFVAKDVEEFSRYLKGVDEFADGLKRLPRESVSQILMEPLGDEAKEREIYKADGGWATLLATDRSLHDLRIYVMLNASNEKDASSKSIIRENLASHDNIILQRRKSFLKSIECYMYHDGYDKFDADTFVFIHWGGGDPTWYEEQFQSFCDVNPETSKGLRAFALSSRRRELFNVTAPKISLPKTKEDAQKLVDGFSFARVKDMMTEYVLHYFSIARKDQSVVSPFETDDKRIPQPLQSFLNSQARRLESRGRFSDVEKCRLQAIKQVLETVKWNEEQLQIPYDEETVELFSALIRGGGHV